MPADDEPLSERDRERLRRQAQRERRRRADEAVARRHARQGDSPARVLGSFIVLLIVLGGPVAAYLAATRDQGARRHTAPGATAKQAAVPTGGDPVRARRPVTINWVGDITLGSRYGTPPDQGRPMFAATRGILRRADITIGNLEGTLSVGGASTCPSAPALPNSTPATCVAFQAPPENAAALQGAGFDLVNLANGHAYDFGRDGQSQTIRALSRYGIRSVGRPGAITTMSVRGVRVAFLGFAPYPWASAIDDLAAARRLVKAAAARADLVVVTMHPGAEGTARVHTPKGARAGFGPRRGGPVAFAHVLVDAGADLVLGSGPRVVRGIERYHGRLIAYSLGTFAGWRNVALGGTLSLSGMLQVRLSADGRLVDGRWQSLVLRGAGTPVVDPSNASARLVDRLSREDFDGVYHMDADGTIDG